VDHVLLDKTGTLTDPDASRWTLGHGSTEARMRLAALVTASAHALAERAPLPAHVAALRMVPGAGVFGDVDGVPCRAGSPAWLTSSGARWDPDVAEHLRSLDDLENEAGSVVALEEGGTVTAFSLVSQPLRPGAEAAIRGLEDLGLQVLVLSGDREGAVASVARTLGVAAAAGQNPEDKLGRVEALRAAGHVTMMVGDGLNDAAALRRADVGVAMATGMSSARAEAGIEILARDLSTLPLLIQGARRLRTIVRGNIFWTLAYNGAALAAAASGHLPPLLAVAAMVVSSLTVSVRSYGLLGFGTAGHAHPAGTTGA
jgi:Cu+-exporting ATPase